mgnify:CR=1 FL=1
MSEKIVTLNEEVIKGEIRELVRGSVEETLNNLLEAEADKLTQARRYERSEARQGYRSGHYDRGLTTTSGEVTLHVPRLKGISFETAIIERYRRRESSVEEALIEMYLAGVSVRRVVRCILHSIGDYLLASSHAFCQNAHVGLKSPRRDRPHLRRDNFDGVRFGVYYGRTCNSQFAKGQDPHRRFGNRIVHGMQVFLRKQPDCKTFRRNFRLKIPRVRYLRTRLIFGVKL